MGDAGPNVFAAALGWLNGVLTGTMAIIVATISIASIGFLLMSGRICLRRAAQILVGCFVLFGASAISAGIIDLLRGDGGLPETASLPAPPAHVLPVQNRPQPYDPYAAASLPSRR